MTYPRRRAEPVKRPQSHTSLHARGGGNETLPLFEAAPAALSPLPPGSAARRHPEAEALALHLFWTISLESYALGHAAQRADHPDECRALLELHQQAEALRETARTILADIWRIKIGRSNLAPPTAKTSDGLGMAS